MSRASAITDGDTVLATVRLDVSAQRACEALNSAEVERWWGAPGLYQMRNWRADFPSQGRMER